MNRRLHLIGIQIALAWLATPALGQWSQTQKLLPADGWAYDWFGESVSVCGDVAIVGAHGNDDNEAVSGSAYVFRRIGATWVQEAKLLPDDGSAYDSFGFAVAVSDDVAVIGAYGDDRRDPNDYIDPNDPNDPNGVNRGSAYVFRYDGSIWNQEAELVADHGSRLEYFGDSVSVSGDTVVVGTRRHSAYIFRHIGSRWVQEEHLQGEAADVFGAHVSVSGDVAVIGAPLDSDNGNNAGAAHVFRRDDNGTPNDPNDDWWAHEEKLLADDGAAHDIFGRCVLVDGDTVVVGAAGDDENGTYSGSAYVFRRNGANWVQEDKLLPDDGAAQALFGISVSVAEDTAVIGAYSDHAGGTRRGSAYVFQRSDNGTPGDAGDDSWSQTDKLVASDGVDEAQFGCSVSVSGSAAVIGAFFDNQNGRQSGSAYVFVLCQGDVNGDGVVSLSDLAIVVANFGTANASRSQGDLNHDGLVNLTDLAELLANFGASC